MGNMAKIAKTKKIVITLIVLFFFISNISIFFFSSMTWIKVRDYPQYVDNSDDDIQSVFIYKESYNSIPYDSIPYIYPQKYKGIMFTKDVVPTRDAAIRIAEVVLSSIFKDSSYQYKFISVSLVSKAYWIVRAKKGTDSFGGDLYIEIQKKDGKILRVILGK